MALPKWSTPARQRRLMQLGMAYRGRCLKGHLPCWATSSGDFSHFVHRYTKVEIASGPISSADVRDGRAIPYPCHGVGIVELAHAVSGARPIGPKRVSVQHEELSDLYGLAEERVIDDWKREDREARAYKAKLDSELHPSGDQRGFGKLINTHLRHLEMDPVQRQQWNDTKPEYKLVGFGVNAQKMSRTAEVRIPGQNIRLFVDVPVNLSTLSANKRRKVLRYGHKAKVSGKEVHELCLSAVRQWWAKRPR